MSEPHQHGTGHDHDHGDGHDEGGHEIDRMPNARLFNLLFGLSALTLLACIGVIQLFNMQVDALEHTRADQGSFRIHEYTEEMNKQKSGWGKVEVKELDDKNTTTTRYYMPVASAKKAVLEDPNLLKALAPPQGWKTADDRAPAAAPPGAAPARGPQPGGAPPAGAPTPTPVPTDGAKPTDAPPTAPPTGDAPAPSKGDDAKEDAKADAKEDAKADDAKAEKPAKKPRPPKPAPAKPEPEPAAETAG